jgi:hypothetical protein
MLGGGIPLGQYVPSASRRSSQRSATYAISRQDDELFTNGISSKLATKMAVEMEDSAEITHLVLLMGQPIIPTPEQLGQMGDLDKNLRAEVSRGVRDLGSRVLELPMSPPAAWVTRKDRTRED